MVKGALVGLLKLGAHVGRSVGLSEGKAVDGRKVGGDSVGDRTAEGDKVGVADGGNVVVSKHSSNTELYAADFEHQDTDNCAGNTVRSRWASQLAESIIRSI